VNGQPPRLALERTPKTGIANGLWQAIKYRGGTGHLAFIGHRLAGLGTLLFLIIHVTETSAVYFNPQFYADVVARYQHPVFMLGEIGLVAAVLFHGLNGVRIIAFDWKPDLWSPEREHFWSLAVFGATFALWLPAAFVMGRSLYLHSILMEPVPAAITPEQVGTGWANAAVILLVAAGLVVASAASARPGSGRHAAIKPTLETRMWAFMRYSGVLLIPLAYGHVLIKDILHGVHLINLAYVDLYWSFLGWRIYDAALLSFALAHGAYGLKQVSEDYVHSPLRLRFTKYAILGGWLIITAMGAIALVGGVAATLT
jgi:succinate dehydrogenase cytochrome b556 subunit